MRELHLSGLRESRFRKERCDEDSASIPLTNDVSTVQCMCSGFMRDCEADTISSRIRAWRVGSAASNHVCTRVKSLVI